MLRRGHNAAVIVSAEVGSRTMRLQFRTSIAWFVTAVVLAIGCASTVDTQEPRRPRNVEEFDAMFQELNNWGRWGADDELGTMNLITP